MDPTPWSLLDTETTGIKAPIYVVELAAQRVRGWEPARVGRNAIAVPPSRWLGSWRIAPRASAL